MGTWTTDRSSPEAVSKVSTSPSSDAATPSSRSPFRSRSTSLPTAAGGRGPSNAIARTESSETFAGGSHSETHIATPPGTESEPTMRCPSTNCITPSEPMGESTARAGRSATTASTVDGSGGSSSGPISATDPSVRRIRSDGRSASTDSEDRSRMRGAVIVTGRSWPAPIGANCRCGAADPHGARHAANGIARMGRTRSTFTSGRSAGIAWASA